MYSAEAMRAELRDDDLGFCVLRNFYSDWEIDEYRRECERFLHRGKVIHCRITTDSMRDYVHPKSHDDEARTYRIYQFHHNHRDDTIGQFLSRALALRGEIESAWLDDEAYRKEIGALQFHSVVTYYVRQKGMLPKHKDYSGPPRSR